MSLLNCPECGGREGAGRVLRGREERGWGRMGFCCRVRLSGEVWGLSGFVKQIFFGTTPELWRGIDISVSIPRRIHIQRREKVTTPLE